MQVHVLLYIVHVCFNIIGTGVSRHVCWYLQIALPVMDQVCTTVLSSSNSSLIVYVTAVHGNCRIFGA